MKNSTQVNKKQRVLVWDLEVTAHEGFHWGSSWETSIIEHTGYGKILSFSAKWLGGKQITKGWCDYPRQKEKRLIKDLWKLMNEADVLIGHNSKSFDNKWANTRFAKYGLSAPSPYKTIDTKTEAKKAFYLPSYSLNNICDYYGIGHKVEHEGFPLWKKCIKGDPKAWERMKTYNAQDVKLTEKVYLKLLPFMSTHPVSTLSGCVACGGVLQRRGFTLTRAGKKQRTQCSNCYRWDFIRK